MATAVTAAAVPVWLPEARHRPRAKLRGAYVVRASGRVRVKVASNARRVKLTYRTAQGKRRTSIVIIRNGHGRETLREGSKRIYAKAQSTRRLRASHWIRIRLVEVPTVTPPLSPQMITAGAWHTCGVDTSGAAWCWGLNANGRLGAGDFSPIMEHAPVSVVGGHTFTDIAAGAGHTCGLDTSGAAWCWGEDDVGHLGDGDDGQSDENTPVPVAGRHTFTALDAGGLHTCGLDTSGAAWCWGWDGRGQVGDGDDGQGDEYAPVAVVGGHTFTALTATGSNTCGLDTSGAAWCWGWDIHGQLGDGDDGQGDEFAPVAVVGGHTFTALTAGGDNTCGLDTSGAAWCWGRDISGQLGDGDDGQGDEFAPVAVVGRHTFTALTAGGDNTCGLDTSGAAWCWGSDYYGQVGDGDDGDFNTTPKPVPVPVVGGHTFATSTSGNHS